MADKYIYMKKVNTNICTKLLPRIAALLKIDIGYINKTLGSSKQQMTDACSLQSEVTADTVVQAHRTALEKISSESTKL